LLDFDRVYLVNGVKKMHESKDRWFPGMEGGAQTSLMCHELFEISQGPSFHEHSTIYIYTFRTIQLPRMNI